MFLFEIGTKVYFYYHSTKQNDRKKSEKATKRYILLLLHDIYVCFLNLNIDKWFDKLRLTLI